MLYSLQRMRKQAFDAVSELKGIDCYLAEGKSWTHDADTVRSRTELAFVEFHATRIGCT